MPLQVWRLNPGLSRQKNSRLPLQEPTEDLVSFAVSGSGPKKDVFFETYGDSPEFTRIHNPVVYMEDEVLPEEDVDMPNEDDQELLIDYGDEDDDDFL